MAGSPLDTLGWVLVVVNWVGWIVMLAGVATVTNDSNKTYNLGIWWWGVWFQFITLVLVVVTLAAAPPKGWVNLRRDFLVMVTVLMMWLAQDEIDLSSAADDRLFGGARTALGGTIMCIILNFGMMFYCAFEVGASTWKAGPPSLPAKAPACGGATASVAAAAAPGRQQPLPFPSVA